MNNMDNINQQIYDKLDLEHLNSLYSMDNMILKEMVDAVRQEKEELVNDIIVLESVLSAVQKKSTK